MVLLFLQILLFAVPVLIEPGVQEVQLDIKDLDFYEDPTRDLSFEEIRQTSFQANFNKDLQFSPQDYNEGSAYWVKLTTILPDNDGGYLIEFFDQTIDSLDIYLRHEEDSAFDHFQMGDHFPFDKKSLSHKNFQKQLPLPGTYIVYFRVASHEYADIRVAIRSIDRFVGYALFEYYLYGVLYGMILIISLYNLLIYSAIREIKYLYYTFYILSVGLFSMSIDGIGFQYLWPNSPRWNQIAHGVSLFSIIFWAIVFSQKFLNLKIRAPKVHRILQIVLIARIALFLYTLLWDHSLFSFRNIELIPLLTIFFGSIVVFNRGYKPARYFIVAFGFLFVGFILKALLMLSIIPFYILSYYSLHICFVFEMLFLSFALSDRVRILKSNRDRAHRRIIAQHENNARLKDQMNINLEKQVSSRTNELQEKNQLLQKQKQEISEINSILDLDNWRLRNNIKSIQRERILNKELTFQAFSQVFSSQEDCLEVLTQYKWRDGFSCKRCANHNYHNGTTKLSRRCTRCGYQESPTTHTLFHGLRFPIDKAFYILYEMLNEDQYSLAELAETLDLRKNTIWVFKKKIRSHEEFKSRKILQLFDVIEERQVG